jgi:hypothetical protein
MLASCVITQPTNQSCGNTLDVKALVSSAEWAEATYSCGSWSWGGVGILAEGETASGLTVCVSRDQDVWDNMDACARITT